MNSLGKQKWESLNLGYSKNSNFEYFDILELLNQKRRKGEIRSKDEETVYIIELQNREEELIEDGKICGKCKAIESLKDGKCLACEKNALKPL